MEKGILELANGSNSKISNHKKQTNPNSQNPKIVIRHPERLFLCSLGEVGSEGSREPAISKTDLIYIGP